MTQKHEKHLPATGMMPTLSIEKCFLNKALHLASVLGPKPAGSNSDFAGDLGDGAGSKWALFSMPLPGPRATWMT